MFFYGLSFALSGVAVVGTWSCARRRGNLKPSISDAQARAIEHRYLVGPSLYAVSAIIGLIAPIVALVLYAFLVVFFWYPGRALGSSPDQDREPPASYEKDQTTPETPDRKDDTPA
jgi:hypothetical protein